MNLPLKRLAALTLTLVLTLSVSAQREQDFATRFVKLYDKGPVKLERNTVSPLMMERILDLKTVEEDKSKQELLRDIRTVQIVVSEDTLMADSLYQLAQSLAQRNARRYQVYANDDERAVYLRKRNDWILEIVLISKRNNTFSIVALTGKMDDDFLAQLAEGPENGNNEE